jgi:uncharacterized OB-fold protein
MGIPVLWRSQKERYSLQGEVCPACDRAVFPPRRFCPYCGREAEAHSHAVEELPRHEFVFMMSHSAEFAAVGDD